MTTITITTDREQVPLTRDEFVEACAFVCDDEAIAQRITLLLEFLASLATRERAKK